jgi:hypothetical protein
MDKINAKDWQKKSTATFRKAIGYMAVPYVS